MTKNILGKSRLVVYDGAGFGNGHAIASLYMLFKRGVSFYEAMGFKEEDDGPERRHLIELVRRVSFKEYFDDLKPRDKFFVYNLLSQLNLLDYAATESLANVHLRVIDALNPPLPDEHYPYLEGETFYEEEDEAGNIVVHDTRTETQYENSLSAIPRWEHLLLNPYHDVGDALSVLVRDRLQRGLSPDRNLVYRNLYKDL